MTRESRDFVTVGLRALRRSGRAPRGGTGDGRCSWATASPSVHDIYPLSDTYRWACRYCST